MTDLDKLREVAEAALDGQWSAAPYGDGSSLQGCLNVLCGKKAEVIIAENIPKIEAHFIATFDPPTVLSLIDRLKAAEDDADLGETFLKTYEAACKHPLLNGYHPMDSPTEVVFDLLTRLEEAEAENEKLRDEAALLLTECLALARSLYRKHFRDEHRAKGLIWEPLNDALGLLSQIDNMTTGLSRKALKDKDNG